MCAKKTVKSSKVRKARHSDATVTREMLIPMFEDMKDFVRSTVKGSEIILRRELKNDTGRLEVVVIENSKRIKKLDTKIDGFRTELKEDMHQMEGRLGKKIDGNTEKLADHESRITIIEDNRL